MRCPSLTTLLLLSSLALAAGCGADRRGRGGGGGGGGGGGTPYPGDAGEGDTGEGAEDGPRAVCEHWLTERQQVNEEWEPDRDDDGSCALGRVPDDAQDNAIRRTNLYRWLVGVEPVRLERMLLQQEQECAVVMAAMGTITHNPPPSAPCYTAAAATAAQSSNLSYGSGLADSVDMYVDDGGVPTLGHRRWVLNPGARVTAFGYRPRAGCMYSFSDDRSYEKDFVAWPPAGYVPLGAAAGRWSFAAYDLVLRGDVSFSVSVDGEELTPIEADRLEDGYGGMAPTWAFDVRGSFARRHDRSVRIVVEGTGRGEADYTVHFVDCARVLGGE